MNRLIDLGKLRFHFRGDWDQNTAYELNDMVAYGASMYLYTFAVKEAGTPPSSDTHWQLVVRGMRHRGVLTAGVQYLLGDVVADGASSRVALSTFVSSGSFGTDTAAKWGLVALGQASVPDPLGKTPGLMVITRNGGYELQAPRDLMRHVSAGQSVLAFDGADITSDTRLGMAEVLLPADPQGGEKVTIRDSANSWNVAPVAMRRNNASKQINGMSSDLALDEPGGTVVAIYINHELQWRTQE